MNVGFTPFARVEYDAVLAWYESHAPSVAIQFESELRDALDRIKRHPEHAPIIGAEFRRLKLRRFPYGVVYAIRQDVIVVLSIMHLHRKPGYWKGQFDED